MKEAFSAEELYSMRCGALLRDNPEVAIAWGAALANQLKFGAALADAGLDELDAATLISDCYRHAQSEILRRRHAMEEQK